MIDNKLIYQHIYLTEKPKYYYKIIFLYLNHQGDFLLTLMKLDIFIGIL